MVFRMGRESSLIVSEWMERSAGGSDSVVCPGLNRMIRINAIPDRASVLIFIPV
jgi:hypothetical protein